MRTWLKTFFILLGAVFAVIIVKLLLMFQLTATDNSLRPAVLPGDRVLVSRLSYGLRLPFERFFGYHRISPSQPQRGDLLAYNDPLQRTPFLSSRPICTGRCLAIPGDTLWLFVKVSQGDTLPPHTVWKPFIVPRKGEKIKIEPWNIRLLSNTLRIHEGANICEDGDSILVVDGTPLRSIRFNQDYLWISARGDTATYDSRIFGFLPVSHVIGKLLCTSFSKQSFSAFYNGFRMERFFRSLKTNSSNK